MDISRIFKYASLTLIGILFLALGGWYIYLRSETRSIASTAQGRGFGVTIPTPSSLGNTFSNIIESFRGAPGAAQQGADSISQSFGSGISGITDSVKDAFGNLVSNFDADPDPTEVKTTPRLWQVQKTPVAGFGFINGTTILRFAERSSGYLFDTNVQTGDIRRITNTLIPKVYEVRFARDGSPVLQTLESAGRQTYSGTVATSTSEDSLAELILTPLGANVLRAIPSFVSRELLTLVETDAGSALIRSGWNGARPSTLFTSSLKGWNIHWPADGKIVLAQHGATGIGGSAYELSSAGELQPLVRSVPGLSVLPRATSTVFLSSSDNGVLSTSLRTNSGNQPVLLAIQTISEKCVWSRTQLIAYCAVPTTISSRIFLDEWHRGEIHTSDAWWSINASTGETELLYSPSRERGISLDVESPRIDDSNTYLAFVDARDKSLWVLRIRE